MKKQELIEKAESCRALAEEILDEVIKDKGHWQLVYRAERMLDAAEFFLIFLNREDEHGKVNFYFELAGY